jgi:SAM-dependent methyltransferase
LWRLIPSEAALVPWDWSFVLVCPRCRAELVVAGEVCCPRCGRVGQLICDRFIDFGFNRAEAARAITGWPEDFVRELPAWAAGLARGEASDGAVCHETLHRHGLVGADGSLTPLGRDLCYHLDEYRWQKGRKGLDGVLELSAIGPTVRALDVGCGAGQTLRLLDPDRPVELFGVDADPVALALGWRLAKAEGVEVTFAGASATALPFRQGTFDLVLTRVALNYMHQRSAVREMARVLRPGGFLFCRVERIWHDLKLLGAARGLKALVSGLRDLGWGTVHALTGWQPTPGNSLRGGRAFASAGRLRRILSQLGCRVLHAAESPNGPLLAGRRTQLIVVARKRGGEKEDRKGTS